MPATCGAAIDVPLIVLNVPMSVGPGPSCGSRPVEQIGRYRRQADVMVSPGAETSGYVDWSPSMPREEYPDTSPSRVPLSRSLYDATERTPPVGSCPGGLVRLSAPSPPSLPPAPTVNNSS